MKEYITEIVKVISNTCKSEMIYTKVSEGEIKHTISQVQNIYDLGKLNAVRRQRNDNTLRYRVVVERESTNSEIKAYLKICNEITEKENLKKIKEQQFLIAKEAEANEQIMREANNNIISPIIEKYNENRDEIESNLKDYLKDYDVESYEIISWKNLMKLLNGTVFPLSTEYEIIGSYSDLFVLINVKGSERKVLIGNPIKNSDYYVENVITNGGNYSNKDLSNYNEVYDCLMSYLDKTIQTLQIYIN